MRKIIKTLAAAMGVAILLLPTKTYAQDKFTVNGKADFVSDYIWRGADQNSGFSVQPSLTLGYAGFSINVWGSQTLSRWNVEIPSKEFDINLSYSSKLNSSYKCNGIHINNLFKFFVWCEVSKSFTRSII